MNFMKNFVAKLTKYEVKMARKTERVAKKRVRDKQMRIDRNLKVLWSEWFKHFLFILSMNRVEQYKAIHGEALDLFIRKNADYGDAFATFGTIGVLVRIQDKLNRAISLDKNKISLVDESIRDTLLDLHNYAAMALMLHGEGH